MLPLTKRQREILDYLNEFIRQHGYAPAPSHALGFGTTLDPANAPWGGLPRPAIIIGSTRDEAYLRVAELWARQVGCPVYPLDFNFVGQFSVTLPPDWWTLMRDAWERVVDPKRLALRLEQIKGLIAYLEVLFDRPLSLARLREVGVGTGGHRGPGRHRGPG